MAGSNIYKQIKARRQMGRRATESSLARTITRRSEDEYLEAQKRAIALMEKLKDASTQFVAREKVRTNDHKDGVVDRVDPRTGSVHVRLRTGRIVSYAPSALTKQ